MKDSFVDREAVERLLLLSGAVRSGLIDALAREGAWSADEVASISENDLRATRVMLEALVAEGVAERLRGGDVVRYRLSEVGRMHLVDEGPLLERSSLLHLANRVRGWLDLPEVVRSGRPLTKDPARRDVRSFASAMGERDPEILDEIVERCLTFAGRVRNMIDIGGAVGHVARQFGRCGIKATLFDREGVMPIAREYLGSAAGDIALVSGDFTQGLPPGPFDLAYLGNVSHIYGPDTNVRLIAEVHSLLAPGGTIAIQDLVWGRTPRAAIFAVSMLQATEDGGVWTEEQYRQWLTGAGFAEIEVVDLESARAQLILGRKPRSAA
jgi:3-hydroxy-5-methyl-1-naphthoate 3-O-methyltransferase